jgi:hypothetical protein
MDDEDIENQLFEEAHELMQLSRLKKIHAIKDCQPILIFGTRQEEIILLVRE